jgi:hypothetical protein
MARRKAPRRIRRRRPPWWFMPVIMSGLAFAAAGLSAMMMTVVE